MVDHKEQVEKRYPVSTTFTDPFRGHQHFVSVPSTILSTSTDL